MIIATTTDHGTDEDSDMASRVTRSVMDSFMRRPSLEDHAIRTIATMANNDLCMLRASTEEPILCDAAFILMDRNRARFLISGRSAAYHFYEGKLKDRSDPTDAPLIGAGVRYIPRLEPVFTLDKGRQAFLTLSGGLAQNVSAEGLEGALQSSQTAEEWMEKLRAIAGQNEVFCAVTAFLPEDGPGMLRNLFAHEQ